MSHKVTSKDKRRTYEMECIGCENRELISLHPMDLAGGIGYYCQVCQETTVWLYPKTHFQEVIETWGEDKIYYFATDSWLHELMPEKYHKKMGES